MPVSPPIISDSDSESHELDHHNLLLAHLFVSLTKAQAMQRFLILPSKNSTIAALMYASFPPIASTDNIATTNVTPRTITYIHALIVDSIWLHHSDAHNERVIEIRKCEHVLNEMSPDAFREELSQVLNKYHVEITKTAGASGRSARKTFLRSFGSAAVSAEEAGAAGGDAPSADPPAAPAAGVASAEAASAEAVPARLRPRPLL
jgi:hypothetical protein